MGLLQTWRRFDKWGEEGEERREKWACVCACVCVWGGGGTNTRFGFGNPEVQRTEI